MKTLLTLFVLFFSSSVFAKELPISLFSLNILDLHSKYIDKNAIEKNVYNDDVFFSYDANNITHIRKNINFDIYSLVTDKKYIHAIEVYKYFEVPDYTLLDKNNNECKKIQNKLNKLIVELYKFDNQLRQYFISKQTSNNEDDTLEKLILVDEIKYSYDVSLKHYDFGNNKQRVNYILVCAYLKDFSVLTLQLNTDRFEKFAIIKNNMIKLEELNFDYLIEDLTGL